jgi:hypothetical protein
MDTKYFYVKDNEPVGPLTLEELLEKDITTKTQIWTKGMEQWAMLESIPELYKALKLKKENPPSFQNEDTIEYKEETPPRFQKEDTTYFQKEDSIQQKEENAPQSKKEKRNQILNSVLLVIVLIAGLCLTAFAFFGDYGDFFPIFIFGYGIIGAFGYSIAEKLRLGNIYLYFIYILFGIFFIGGIILTVGSFFDWGNDLSLPYFIQDLYALWLILVFLAIIMTIYGCLEFLLKKEEKPPQSKKEKRNQILNSVLLGIVLIAGLCLTAFAFFEYDEAYGVPIGWSIIFGYVLIWFFSFVLTENLGLEKLFKKIGNVLFWIFLVGGVILTVITFVLDISFIFNGSVIPDYFPEFTGLYYLCWLIAFFIFITDFLYKKFDIFSSEDSYFEFCFYFFVFILFMRGVFMSIWLIFNDYNQLSDSSKEYYEGWIVVVPSVIFIFFIIFIFQNLSNIFTFLGRMLSFVIAIILIVVVFILIFGAISSFFGINI